jgi:hypothetical protein
MCCIILVYRNYCNKRARRLNESDFDSAAYHTSYTESRKYLSLPDSKVQNFQCKSNIKPPAYVNFRERMAPGIVINLDSQNALGIFKQ